MEKETTNKKSTVKKNDSVNTTETITNEDVKVDEASQKSTEISENKNAKTTRAGTKATKTSAKSSTKATKTSAKSSTKVTKNRNKTSTKSVKASVNIAETRTNKNEEETKANLENEGATTKTGSTKTAKTSVKKNEEETKASPKTKRATTKTGSTKTAKTSVKKNVKVAKKTEKVVETNINENVKDNRVSTNQHATIVINPKEQEIADKEIIEQENLIAQIENINDDLEIAEELNDKDLINSNNTPIDLKSLKYEELDAIKNEIKNNKKSNSSKGKRQAKYKEILKNTIIFILIQIYFIILNVARFQVSNIPYLVSLKVLILVEAIASIVIFEIAYKKDSGSLGLHGVEMLAIGASTICLLDLVNRQNKYIKFVSAAIIGIFILYYLIKIFVISIKKKKARS